MGTMHGMFFPSWRLCRVFEWFILESSIVFFPSMWGSEQRTRRPARHWQRSPCWDAQTSFEELSKGQKEATSTMTWLNWWHEMTWDDLKWYASHDFIRTQLNSSQVKVMSSHMTSIESMSSICPHPSGLRSGCLPPWPSWQVQDFVPEEGVMSSHVDLFIFTCPHLASLLQWPVVWKDWQTCTTLVLHHPSSIVITLRTIVCKHNKAMGVGKGRRGIVSRDLVDDSKYTLYIAYIVAHRCTRVTQCEHVKVATMRWSPANLVIPPCSLPGHKRGAQASARTAHNALPIPGIFAWQRIAA